MNDQFENPFREGLRLQKAAGPCVAVIFGASGDLTKRKLVPALYSLAQQNLLSPAFAIVGTARTRMTHDEFRAAMKEAIAEYAEEGVGNEASWNDFASHIFYQPSDPDDQDSQGMLVDLLKQIDSDFGTGGNRLFYLSIPPSLYRPVVRMLERNGLNKPAENAWVRLIVEKPFGRDLESARQLNRELLEVFQEDQIYRIDHYLGKETVQNIMVLRFANGIFEPLWNYRYIDHVQITASESIGVEKRGRYYEQAGAFRDMVQNHMMQLLTLVAMEPPVSMEAEAVRDEKSKVLRAIRPFHAVNVHRYAVRGQYTEGSVGGEQVPSYRGEQNVAADSKTETYAAVKFFIDNWRWADVPFYLRSGKRLPKRITEIAIQYRKIPHLLFPDNPGGSIQPNFLVLRIQPDEGISMKFGAKLPGQSIQIRQVSMDFQYGTSFGKKSPEAYERLLLDAMLGDSTLYARGDFVEISWKLAMPILEAWQREKHPLAWYPAGSWGPQEADAFVEEDGRRWRRP